MAGVWPQLYPQGKKDARFPQTERHDCFARQKASPIPLPKPQNKQTPRSPRPLPLPAQGEKRGGGGGARVWKPLVKSSPDGPHHRISQWTCSRRKPQVTFRRALCRLGRGGSEGQSEVPGSVSGGKLCAVLAAGGSGRGGSGGGSWEVGPRPRRHAVPGAARTGRPHLSAQIPCLVPRAPTSSASERLLGPTTVP